MIENYMIRYGATRTKWSRESSTFIFGKISRHDHSQKGLDEGVTSS